MLASTMNSRGCTLPPYPAPANTPHWWQFPALSACRAKVRFHVLHSNKDLSCSAFPPWKVCPLNMSIAHHCCPTAALATTDLKKRKTAAWPFYLKTICSTDLEGLLTSVAFWVPSNAWLSMHTARYFVSSCVSKEACKPANVTLYGSALFILLFKRLQKTSEQVPQKYLRLWQYYSCSNNLGFVDILLWSQ